MLPLIFSLAFFILFEGAVFLPGYFWPFVLGAFTLSSYAIWRAAFAKKSSFFVLNFFLVLIAVALLSVLQSVVFSQMIIFAVVLIFYSLAFGYAARNLAAATLVSFAEFLTIVFLILAYQTASAVSGWVVGPVIFVAASSLFFSSIHPMVNLAGALLARFLFFSLLVGFAVTEFYFALARLPFNLPSIDFLVFIIYYGLWDISLRYFSNRLTKKALLFDIAVVLVSFAFIFLSAKWFPN